MNYRELPYNQLQKLAKQRGIKANFKTMELITALENYELDQINVNKVTEDNVIVNDLTLDDLSDIDSLFGSDNSDTPANIVKEVTVTEVTKLKLTNKPITRLTSCATTAINSCMVWLNNAHIDADNTQIKLLAYNYIQDAVKYFQANEPSRLLISDIPTLYDVNTIEITMEQKFEYIYGTKNGSKFVRIHNGKERQELKDDTKQVSPPRWYRRLLSKASKNREMNRKKTEFAINLISPSSKIENKQANDYSPEQLIFWNLYDKLPIVNESLSSSDPNKVTLTDITFCPHVHQIRVNGKFVISSLTVLDSENRVERPVQNFTNKFKTGLLANWSLPFKWELFPSDWMYQHDKNNNHLMQVALENDRLVLYKLSESFTRKIDHDVKQLEGKHHTQLDNAAMYQARTKIADLGSVELIKNNDIQWVASIPRYEYLATMLNKSGKITASEYDKYQELFLTNNTLNVGDRVLCKKKSTGQSVTVTGNYDPVILVKGQVKHVKTDDNCKWLSKIFDSARLKMIKANVRELETKIQNATYQQDVNLGDKRTRDFIRTMTTTYKALIRSHQVEISDTQLQSLANSMLEYLVMKLSMDRRQLVDTKHKLTISDNLMYTDNADYNKRITEFNKLVDKVRAYQNDKGSSHIEQGTGKGLITYKIK
jgi:signal peptidase I